jgi:zinc protease
MKTKALILLLFSAALMLQCKMQTAPEPLTLSADGYGKITLPNGLVAVVNQDKSTSLSAARIIIGGGVLTETSQTNGIGNLMIRMLLKGNSTMTADQISEQLDNLGASVTADCFRDYTAISVSCLTENLDKTLAIISASLQTPTFPEDELTKLKVEVEGQIKGANDNQSQASSDLFAKTAYGDQEYGLRTVGKSEVVAAITAAEIKAYFEKYAGGKNMVVAISTDLPTEQIDQMIQNRFGSIKADAAPIPTPRLALQPEKTGFIQFDRNQSFVYMGYVLDRQDPKAIAEINLLHQTMGAGVGVRLWYLRQTEKLAYAVYTQWQISKSAAIFRAAIGTDTSKVKKALASLEREWDKLEAGGITDSELVTAKVNMKNGLIFQIDTKAGRAGSMANYEFLGYGYRFVLDQIALADSITLADVNEFVRTKLTNDRRYLSVVGKM